MVERRCRGYRYRTDGDFMWRRTGGMVLGSRRSGLRVCVIYDLAGSAGL